MITINTQKEFDALRNEFGNVFVADSLTLKCCIRAHDIFAQDIFAQDIFAKDIYAQNNIYARVINARGIRAQDKDIFAQDIYAKDINARNISVRDINAGDINAQEIRAQDIVAQDIVACYINARGNIKAWKIYAQNINARDIHVRGYIYWQNMSMPIFKSIICKRIRPFSSQRRYWSRRIGVELNGCWEDIEKLIDPMLPELLALDKWTPTERWILQSWADDVARKTCGAVEGETK